MKLNLNKELLNLKGEPFSESLSDILANVLAMSTVGKPAQMITWAVNLTNHGEIDINASDSDFLIEIIEKSPNIINLAKYQLIDEIIRVKTCIKFEGA